MFLVVGAVAAVALRCAHPAICQAVAVELEALRLLAVASHRLVLGLLMLGDLLPNVIYVFLWMR